MKKQISVDKITIQVRGNASGKLIKELAADKDSNDSLMQIMHKANIPIASSCLGEGVCEKCVVNDTLLSCQIRPKDLLKNQLKDQNYVVITVAYL